MPRAAAAEAAAGGGIFLCLLVLFHTIIVKYFHSFEFGEVKSVARFDKNISKAI